MEIPLWLMFIYGFVEIGVIFNFLLVINDIKIDYKKLISMIIIALIITILVRNIYNHYMFLILMGFILYIILIKIYYKESNILKLITGVALVLIIIILPETFFTIKIMETFSNMEYIYLWIITGTPHIIILFLITLIIGKIKNVIENNKAEIY